MKRPILIISDLFGDLRGNKLNSLKKCEPGNTTVIKLGLVKYLMTVILLIIITAAALVAITLVLYEVKIKDAELIDYILIGVFLLLLFLEFMVGRKFIYKIMVKKLKKKYNALMPGLIICEGSMVSIVNELSTPKPTLLIFEPKNYIKWQRIFNIRRKKINDFPFILIIQEVTSSDLEYKKAFKFLDYCDPVASRLEIVELNKIHSALTEIELKAFIEECDLYLT